MSLSDKIASIIRPKKLPPVVAVADADAPTGTTAPLTASSSVRVNSRISVFMSVSSCFGGRTIPPPVMNGLREGMP